MSVWPSASTDYWVRVDKAPREWRDWLAEGTSLAFLGWMGEVPEPRYRIVVGRHGEGGGDDIAFAYRRRKARRKLAEVVESLSTLSTEDFRRQYAISADVVGEDAPRD